MAQPTHHPAHAAHAPHPAHHHKSHKDFTTHEKAMRKQEHELDSLHPVFRSKVMTVLDHMRTKGWRPFVFQGKTRTKEQAKENAKKKTGIVESWHRPDIRGRIGDEVVELYAADIVDERWGWDNGPTKDLNHPFWNDLGGFAKAVALEWGGDWKPPTRRDVAHVQLRIIDAIPENAPVQTA
jgi:hypothetical protein